MAEYIEREAAIGSLLGWAAQLTETYGKNDEYVKCLESAAYNIEQIPAANVRPVSEIEKIIESLQEQADIYNARAKELLVEEGGQVSQYTWAVSLRETYRRIIKTLDDLIS